MLISDFKCIPGVSDSIEIIETWFQGLSSIEITEMSDSQFCITLDAKLNCHLVIKFDPRCIEDYKLTLYIKPYKCPGFSIVIGMPNEVYDNTFGGFNTTIEFIKFIASELKSGKYSQSAKIYYMNTNNCLID